MPNTHQVIAHAYSAFNRRDIDAALATMSESVSWPKASEGGRVVGKAEIRAYWTRQWQEFDPHVESVSMVTLDGLRTEVTVHQVVTTLSGELLSDSEVSHIFTVADGLIQRMDIKPSDASSTAFTRR